MPSFSALVKHRKNRYKQFAPATPSRVTGADYAYHTGTSPCEVIGLDYPDYEFYCTCVASRKVFPQLPNHQLHTVSEYCGYHLANHHHALADAEACAWIAIKIL